MNTTTSANFAGLPVFDGDADAVYTVEVLARLSGVSSETILLYHERGLLQSVPSASPTPCFDDDSIRRLRRLESVRETGGMNLAGLCLVGQLLDEIEELRGRLRRR
jgi:DNA-binding transcriptional MerR regulator